MFVNFNILNQLGSPAINSNTFANRPAAGQTGRLFVSTDTYEIYRDNGTTWDLIGGPGSSTITGTGTATQVAYFTSSQAIGSSANLFWDNINTRLGVGTAVPGAALDIHSTGIIAQLNSTGTTNNGYLAFQRNGSGVWRIGDTYNGGANFFELHNTVLTTDALQVAAATNKTTWQAQETYSTGLARANYFDYNLSVAAGGSFTSPNSITALGASLDLTLAGNATIPGGARSGLDAYNSIRFTGAGTLTHNQGAQIRAYSNLTAGWAFNGTAIGTITHLAGLRALFPDNSGSAVNVTNNYALLLNDQTPNTGTVTYTNRWGIYQEGASDLNYMAANLLLGSTTNSGEKLQVTGTAFISSTLTAFNFVASAGNNTTILNAPNATTGWLQIAMNNTSGSALLGVEGIAAGTLATGTTAYATVLRNYTATNFQIATNNIVRTTITSAGLFGIGTTAPSGLLQLNGVLSTPSDAANLTIKQSGTTYTDGIYLERTGERNGYYMYIGGGLDSLNFRRNYFGAQSDVMSLTRDGNVGINETNATLKLVVSSSSAGVMQLKGTNGGSTNNTQLRFFGSNYNDDLYAIGTEVATGSTNRAFDIYDLIGNASRFRISTAGNVLIGTTTDAGYNLQVNGTANATTLYENGVRVIPSQTGNSGKYLTTDGTTTSWATVSAGKQTAIFRVTTNGSGSVTATQIQGISGVTWAATISGSNIVLTPTPNILTFNSIATGSTAISSGGTILICVPQALGASSQTFSFYNTSNVQVDMSTTATASQRPTILQIIIN